MQSGFMRVWLNNHVFQYPAPSNLNFFWNFGFISGVFLGIQMISGLFLAAHYHPEASLAFNSVEYIMSNVRYGWLLSYTHANGASFFLLAVYIHMARGMYYRSYFGKKAWVWYSGVLIFLCLMATAFLGYVLPWGQMSFWGATVITNLMGSVPWVGQKITWWIWGGYAVGGTTLTRLFVLHFILPFVILGLVFLHIGLLHDVGSNSSTVFSIEASEYIPFYPYFMLKDVFMLLLYLFVFSYFVFFEPNALGHPDNYIKANPLLTPAHIVPEWYFLPFYAMLRCVPHKFGGVLFMFSSIFILFFLPSMSEKTKFDKFINSEAWTADVPYLSGATAYDLTFLFWVLSFIFLGWLGAKPITSPFSISAPFFSAYYFLFFLLYSKPIFGRFFWKH